MSASMRAASRRARRISRAGASARPRGPARLRGPAVRAAGLLTVAVASVGVLTAAAVASPQPAGPRSGMSAAAAARARTMPKAATSTQAPQAAQAPLALTARDRESCPAAATACVDLTEHLTWLQAGGKVSFGPVRMEPGPPGTPHATPHGTFQVSWKAGPNFVSNIYGDPMPWAVFFAPGGIAFHGGSLTKSSHGCVHLTVPNARYYNAHLPIGAEVVVF